MSCESTCQAHCVIADVCESIIIEKEKAYLIIKMLFTAVVILVAAFFIHHWYYIQEKMKISDMAKELLNVRHQNLMHESKVSSLRKALLHYSDVYFQLKSTTTATEDANNNNNDNDENDINFASIY